MSDEFTVEYRASDGFDRFVAINLALEGCGAALIAGSAWMNFAPGILAGFLFLAVGILFLFLHLGNRWRSWRVILGLKSSWVSRGALFAGLLLLSGLLFLFSNGWAWGAFWKAATSVFALLTILYSGFLLSSMTSIPFWNSPLTPILFLLHSTTTGTAILMCLFLWTGELDLTVGSAGKAMGLAACTLLVTVAHVTLMGTSTGAARESVTILLRRGLKWPFLGGAILAGLIVPFAIFGYAYLHEGPATGGLAIMMSVAAALRLIGDYSFRSSLLRAGVFERLM